MLNINALRPLQHYLPKDLMSFGRRPWAKHHEGHTFVIRLVKQQTMRNQNIKYKIYSHVLLYEYISIKTYYSGTFIPSPWRKAIIQA